MSFATTGWYNNALSAILESLGLQHRAVTSLTVRAVVGDVVRITATHVADEQQIDALAAALAEVEFAPVTPLTKAAPRLLEACDTLLAICHDYHTTIDDVFNHIHGELTDAVRAAKGGQP